MNHKFIGRLIKQVGEQIERGDCSMSDEEITALMHMVAHEKWYLPRLEHEFNTTQRTIERWCAEGKLPALHKDDTGRKYLWHDEVIEFQERNNN